MSGRWERAGAFAIALSLAGGCAARSPLGLPTIAAPSPDPDVRLAPQRVQPANPQVSGRAALFQNTKGTMLMMRRMFLHSVTPVAMTFSMLIAAPVHALQQLEAQRQDRPLVRRRAPEGQRRSALAFVRTELFFGTAKPIGAVTEEEFKLFLDNVVTPLFPDGLTLIKADGQFRGADGNTIKEDAYVLVLLYPVDGHKASSRNIDAIRTEYMRQHQQESVLRVDDPLLVWVSF